ILLFSLFELKSFKCSKLYFHFGFRYKNKFGIFGPNENILMEYCSNFIRVNIQGIAIGRTTDLTQLDGYMSLIRKLEDMLEPEGELCGLV
ncbi:unnamed protein product, partial [Ilex paraguariensis]